MGLSIDPNISLYLILISVLQACLVSAYDLAPVNLSFHTLNMNISLTWNPPPDAPSSDSILYTVIRDTIQSEQVPGCINISETRCSLFSVFPTGREFRPNEYFYVTSVLANETARSVVRRFNRDKIEISPPVVYKSSVSSRNVTVYIHGPATPYQRDNQTIFFGDDELSVILYEKFLLHGYKYRATLYRINPNRTERTMEFQKLQNGFAEITFVNLSPYTVYVMEIKSKLYRESRDVNSFEFRTKAAAPEVGPVISGIEVTKRYCDYRDVNISWKDLENQRNNGPLTEYVVDVKSRERNDSRSILVPVSDRTTVMNRLYRWDIYEVIVWAGNEDGRTKGQMSPIEADLPLIETYKPVVKGITKLSTNQWEMTWEPPKIHNQCIVGYHIVTYVNGGVDEETIVYGSNASDVMLNFTKSGRYQIDISPVINDTAGTVAVTTTMYNVEGSKLHQALILSSVGLAVLALAVAVVLMFRKVFCDLSNLPDISKSKSMKIAQNIRPANTVLRKPPEKEIFDATRISPCQTSYRPCPSVSDYSVDDEFRSRSTSRSPLLSSSSSSDGEAYNLLSKRPEQPRNSSEHSQDRPELVSLSSSENQSDDVTTNIAGPGEASPLKRRQRKNRAPKSGSDGYVPKQPLMVYIPPLRAATNTSSPSSSCDSGISGSTYTGSDYAPSSPLSEVDETSEWGDDDDDDSVGRGGGEGQFNSPYVTVEVAIHMGKSKTNSGVSSAGVEGASDAYKRIDSRHTVRGYLEMNPVARNNDSKNCK